MTSVGTGRSGSRLGDWRPKAPIADKEAPALRALSIVLPDRWDLARSSTEGPARFRARGPRQRLRGTLRLQRASQRPTYEEAKR